jgi:hypothetical protein
MTRHLPLRSGLPRATTYRWLYLFVALLALDVVLHLAFHL